MDWRNIAFASFGRRQSAHAANRHRARDKTLIGKTIDDSFKAGAMAAHDGQIGKAQFGIEQGDSRLRAFIQPLGQSVYGEKTIGLRKGGNRARALPQWKSIEARIAV